MVLAMSCTTPKLAVRCGDWCGKYSMRIDEILLKPIKPRAPLTPAQLRIQALKNRVDSDKQQLRLERERQRQQREQERQRKQRQTATVKHV